MRTIPCLVCGKSFSSANSSLCSPECKHLRSLVHSRRQTKKRVYYTIEEGLDVVVSVLGKLLDSGLTFGGSAKSARYPLGRDGEDHPGAGLWKAYNTGSVNDFIREIEEGRATCPRIFAATAGDVATAVVHGRAGIYACLSPEDRKRAEQQATRFDRAREKAADKERKNA